MIEDNEGVDERTHGSWASMLGVAALAGLLAASLVPATACQPNDEDLCEACEVGEDVWICDLGLSWEPICESNDAAADTICTNIGGALGEKITCDGEEIEETGDVDWDPPGSITYNAANGEYEIDAAFVAQLKESPDLLMYDSAYLDENATGGYFKFKGVAQTDMVYLLGLRNNDEPREINGYDLRDFNRAMTAYEAIYNSTLLTLKVKRGTTTLTFKYRIL